MLFQGDTFLSADIPVTIEMTKAKLSAVPSSETKTPGGRRRSTRRMSVAATPDQVSTMYCRRLFNLDNPKEIYKWNLFQRPG